MNPRELQEALADARTALNQADVHVEHWKRVAEHRGEELLTVRRSLKVLERTPNLGAASVEELLGELRRRCTVAEALRAAG